MSVVISVPPYVTVPVLPGIPNVVRQAGALSTVASTFYAVSQYVGIQSENTWGIFDKNGKIALESDSVVAVEFKNDHRISDYPQEKGAFASYNKVTMPFDVIVHVTRGDSVEARTAFIKTLDSLCASFDLYSVITPDATFGNLSFDRYEYSRRSEKGARLIVAELHARQVRISATVLYGSSKDPSAQDVQNQGNIQTQPLPPIPILAPSVIQ